MFVLDLPLPIEVFVYLRLIIRILFCISAHLRASLVRPEAIAYGADLSFSPDVYFFSTRDLRDAWADRREILHDGQY